MRAIRPVLQILFFLFLFSFTAFAAQKPAPPLPPQTARQALLEMFNGGQNDVNRHLTAEVQELLKQPRNLPALSIFGMFGSLKAESGGNLQTFESGPVLLSISEPAQHEKFELRVESDDLNDNQDTLQLSLHMLRDGQEQQDMLAMLSSHVTVTMIRQQEIWRLSSFGVGIEMPLGNSEFLQNMARALNHQGATGVGKLAPGVSTYEYDVHPHETATASLQAVELPPPSLPTMLGMAETAFARQHAETGFTCALSDLAETGKSFGLDSQIFTGLYKGYRISVTGCQGRPAGSFQIVVEPVSAAAGVKAYCVDATQNVRASDDGRGATCLASGALVGGAEDEDSAGMHAFRVGTADKPKN
jgi:hypothetical protein